MAEQLSADIPALTEDEKIALEGELQYAADIRAERLAVFVRGEILSALRDYAAAPPDATEEEVRPLHNVLTRIESTLAKVSDHRQAIFASAEDMTSHLQMILGTVENEVNAALESANGHVTLARPMLQAIQKALHQARAAFHIHALSDNYQEQLLDVVGDTHLSQPLSATQFLAIQQKEAPPVAQILFDAKGAEDEGLWNQTVQTLIDQRNVVISDRDDAETPGEFEYASEGNFPISSFVPQHSVFIISAEQAQLHFNIAIEKLKQYYRTCVLKDKSIMTSADELSEALQAYKSTLKIYLQEGTRFLDVLIDDFTQRMQGVSQGLFPLPEKIINTLKRDLIRHSEEQPNPFIWKGAHTNKITEYVVGESLKIPKDIYLKRCSPDRLNKLISLLLLHLEFKDKNAIESKIRSDFFEYCSVLSNSLTEITNRIFEDQSEMQQASQHYSLYTEYLAVLQTDSDVFSFLSKDEREFLIGNLHAFIRHSFAHDYHQDRVICPSLSLQENGTPFPVPPALLDNSIFDRLSEYLSTSEKQEVADEETWRVRRAELDRWFERYITNHIVLSNEYIKEDIIREQWTLLCEQRRAVHEQTQQKILEYLQEQSIDPKNVLDIIKTTKDMQESVSNSFQGILDEILHPDDMNEYPWIVPDFLNRLSKLLEEIHCLVQPRLSNRASLSILPKFRKIFLKFSTEERGELVKLHENFIVAIRANTSPWVLNNILSLTPGDSDSSIMICASNPLDFNIKNLDQYMTLLLQEASSVWGKYIHEQAPAAWHGFSSAIQECLSDLRSVIRTEAGHITFPKSKILTPEQGLEMYKKAVLLIKNTESPNSSSLPKEIYEEVMFTYRQLLLRTAMLGFVHFQKKFSACRCDDIDQLRKHPIFEGWANRHTIGVAAEENALQATEEETNQKEKGTMQEKEKEIDPATMTFVRAWWKVALDDAVVRTKVEAQDGVVQSQVLRKVHDMFDEFLKTTSLQNAERDSGDEEYFTATSQWDDVMATLESTLQRLPERITIQHQSVPVPLLAWQQFLRERLAYLSSRIRPLLPVPIEAPTIPDVSQTTSEPTGSDSEPTTRPSEPAPIVDEDVERESATIAAVLQPTMDRLQHVRRVLIQQEKYALHVLHDPRADANAKKKAEVALRRMREIADLFVGTLNDQMDFTLPALNDEH